MSDARNADAFASSICDADRISFMSYLNGASLWVLSIDCFLVASFVFGFDLWEFGEAVVFAGIPLPIADASLLTGSFLVEFL